MRKKSPYERKKEGEEGGKGAIFVLSRSGGIEDKATRERGGRAPFFYSLEGKFLGTRTPVPCVSPSYLV